VRIRQMTLCALFAALTAICAQIVLPIGPVPVNLALLPVLVCGALLPVGQAVVTMLVYIGMGAAGLPVFAGMTGGPGVLLGPTGGYLLGYVLCAAVVAGLIRQGVKRSLAMAAGVAACYLPGVAWLMIATGMSLPQALASGALSFLPGDVLKLFAADYLSKRLYLVVRP